MEMAQTTDCFFYQVGPTANQKDANFISIPKMHHFHTQICASAHARMVRQNRLLQHILDHSIIKEIYQANEDIRNITMKQKTRIIIFKILCTI